mgnify:CR=1 FL=1
MKFKNLPKIELHVHLDCSLSYETIKRLRPQTTIDDYNTNYIAGKSCTSLKQYIKCADNAISLMQSKESLELVMEDFFNQLIQDNVIYCEIRFAPLLHTDEGLNSREVVNILCNSMNFLSSILKAKYIPLNPNNVIKRRTFCSSKKFIPTKNISFIQLVPLIMRPETIVERLHVAAIKDSASVLLFEFVFLMTKGNEQTLINIIPKPHSKKENFINKLKSK